MSWIKIDTVGVPVAMVNDMPKRDDSMPSELSNNVCDFIETNKMIFLQCKAEFALSVEQSSEFIVVIPPPARSITNVLMNRKLSYPQLK